MKNLQNNEEVNHKINELEQKAIELRQLKGKIVANMQEARLKYVKELNETDTLLHQINAELASMRRSYKTIQFRRITNRLSEDAKKIILEVKGEKCEKCEKCGSTENIEIHHKTPLSEGGTNDLTNLEIA